MYYVRLLLLLAMFQICAPVAFAQQTSSRLALVVANSDYNLDNRTDTATSFSDLQGYVSDLRNPVNDGARVTTALEGLGFDVTYISNATRERMGAALALFGAKIDEAPSSAIVVIYYSGHAIQVAGRNYLIPAGARIPREQDMSRLPELRAASFIRTYAISTDDIFEQLRPPDAGGLNVIIIDACRNNPWEDRRFGRGRGMSSPRGLARDAPSLGRTLVAYSTAPGAVAADGSEIAGANSPYTAALLRRLPMPGYNVLQMFNNVGRDVWTATGQIPWVSSAPIDDICLAGCQTNVAAALSQERSPPSPPPSNPGVPTNAAAMQTTPSDQIGIRGYVFVNTLAGRDLTDTVGRFAVRAVLIGTTVRQLRWMAETGDRTAQTLLGIALLDGIASDRNAEEAVTWFQRAAEQNEPSAQYFLGASYQEGTGIPQDYGQAMAWYRSAATQGNVSALVGIGFLYDSGFGVTPDPAEAMQWYRRAADRGNIPAQTLVGTLFEEGRGVERSYAQAASWYRRAADQGVGNAQFRLGRILHDGGFGLSPDPDAGRARIGRAAAGGHPLAQLWLRQNPAGPSRP